MDSRLCGMLLLLLAGAGNTRADNNPGTTPHFQDIFIGRCYDYTEVKFKSLMPKVSTDCRTLYQLFFVAFSYRPPCALTMDHYQPFIQAASQKLDPHKTMFWSGLKTLALDYAAAGLRYVTLENTLIGYLVDSLVWCGQGEPPGMNFSRCPSWSDCPSEASQSFWAAASKSFAESSRGNVTVLLDGSHTDRPAYRRDSFFGTFELPNLNNKIVTGVNVLLVHPLDIPVVESCGNASLLLLEQDVKARGLAFSCVNDPQAILHLLCADHPFDLQCQLAHQYMLQGTSRTTGAIQPRVFNAKPDRFGAIEKSAIKVVD